MLRQIWEKYPKAYKSPQTRISLIMIGYSSRSYVVLFLCKNACWWTI